MDTDTNSAKSFLFSGEPETIDITVRGATQQFQLHDISKGQFEKLNEEKVKAGNDAAKIAQADRNFGNKLISSVVRFSDGSAISVEDADNIRLPVYLPLTKAAAEFLFGKDKVDAATAEAAAAAEAGNASTATT